MQYHFSVLFLSLWVSPGTAMSETMTFRMTNPGRCVGDFCGPVGGWFLTGVFLMEHKIVLVRCCKAGSIGQSMLYVAARPLQTHKMMWKWMKGMIYRYVFSTAGFLPTDTDIIFWQFLWTELAPPTLPKTNIAPENWSSQKKSSLPTTIFRGLC